MDTKQINQLGRWFESEAGALVLYARQWLDPSTAEDVVQEVFVSLMAQPAWPENPKPWLYRAVRYRALKVLRADRRRLQRESRVADDAVPWLEARGADALDAREAEQALQRLAPDEREAVTLRIWGGLKLEEIAAVLGSSVPTVFRRYRSGLQRLRQLMESPCTTNVN